MTTFNPEKKVTLTYRECLDPIFKITDKEDAIQYKQAYINYTMQFVGNNKAKAEEVVNSNIGYYAGYGSHADRERIEKLFDCAHPVFGSANL